MINKFHPLLENEQIESRLAATEWQSEREKRINSHIIELYPTFEKNFFNNFFSIENPNLVNEKHNYSNFKAIKMMCITKYDRIYKCSRKDIGINDINDTFISAFITYMDAIIMEKHQVEVVKQNTSKISGLEKVERYTISDLIKQDY